MEVEEGKCLFLHWGRPPLPGLCMCCTTPTAKKLETSREQCYLETEERCRGRMGALGKIFMNILVVTAATDRT